MQPSADSVSVPRRPLDVEDYIDIIRRNWNWIAGPVLAGLVIGVVVAFLWPDTYLSWATLRIVPPQVPERVIPANFNRQMSERLDAIWQKVASRDSLIGVIGGVNLYRTERARKPIEDVWAQMRKDLKIVPLGSRQEQRGLSYVFQIQFKYKDRTGAKAAVDELTRRLRDQTTKERIDASSQTRRFLAQQRDEAQKDLLALEDRRAKFRTANYGRLPEERQLNFQTLQSLQVQLASVNEAINRAGQERLMLETQLQNIKDQVNAARAVQDDAGVAVKNERLVQLNRAIVDMETTVSALRETYREEHPDIRSAKARLEVLKRERDKLAKAEEQKTDGPANKNPDPAAAKSIRDLEGVRRNIESRIQVSNLDTEERTKMQRQILAQIESFQQRIQASPMEEGRYNEVSRDYQLAKERYDDLSLKLKQSEMADEMEQNFQGETLELLEPGFLPQTPVEPNRLVIVGAGLGMGFMLGLALTGAREAKDTALKSLKDVRAYTNVPVLSTVPLLENGVVVRRKRRLVWLAWSTATIIGILIMSSSLYYYFFVVQRSTGS